MQHPAAPTYRWLARRATRDAFTRQFGEIEARVGTGPELAQYGGKSDRSLRRLADVVAQFGTEEDADNEFFVFDMEVSKQLAGSFTQPPLFSDTFMSPAAGARWNMLSLGGGRAAISLSQEKTRSHSVFTPTALCCRDVHGGQGRGAAPAELCL